MATLPQDDFSLEGSGPLVVPDLGAYGERDIAQALGEFEALGGAPGDVAATTGRRSIKKKPVPKVAPVFNTMTVEEGKSGAKPLDPAKTAPRAPLVLPTKEEADAARKEYLDKRLEARKESSKETSAQRRERGVAANKRQTAQRLGLKAAKSQHSEEVNQRYIATLEMMQDSKTINLLETLMEMANATTTMPVKGIPPRVAARLIKMKEDNSLERFVDYMSKNKLDLAEFGQIMGYTGKTTQANALLWARLGLLNMSSALGYIGIDVSERLHAISNQNGDYFQLAVNWFRGLASSMSDMDKALAPQLMSTLEGILTDNQPGVGANFRTLMKFRVKINHIHLPKLKKITPEQYSADLSESLGYPIKAVEASMDPDEDGEKEQALFTLDYDNTMKVNYFGRRGGNAFIAPSSRILDPFVQFMNKPMNSDTARNVYSLTMEVLDAMNNHYIGRGSPLGQLTRLTEVAKISEFRIQNQNNTVTADAFHRFGSEYFNVLNLDANLVARKREIVKSMCSATDLKTSLTFLVKEVDAGGDEESLSFNLPNSTSEAGFPFDGKNVKQVLPSILKLASEVFNDIAHMDDLPLRRKHPYVWLSAAKPKMEISDFPHPVLKPEDLNDQLQTPDMFSSMINKEASDVAEDLYYSIDKNRTIFVASKCWGFPAGLMESMLGHGISFFNFLGALGGFNGTTDSRVVELANMGVYPLKALSPTKGGFDTFVRHLFNQFPFDGSAMSMTIDTFFYPYSDNLYVTLTMMEDEIFPAALVETPSGCPPEFYEHIPGVVSLKVVSIRGIPQDAGATRITFRVSDEQAGTGGYKPLKSVIGSSYSLSAETSDSMAIRLEANGLDLTGEVTSYDLTNLSAIEVALTGAGPQVTISLELSAPGLIRVKKGARVMFSLDASKMEASHSNSDATSFFVNESSYYQMTGTWRKMWERVLPSASVDATSVFGNMGFKIPQLGSGVPHTFALNDYKMSTFARYVQSIIAQRVELGRMLGVSEITVREILELAEVFGLKLKVERVIVYEVGVAPIATGEVVRADILGMSIGVLEGYTSYSYQGKTATELYVPVMERERFIRSLIFEKTDSRKRVETIVRTVNTLAKITSLFMFGGYYYPEMGDLLRDIQSYNVRSMTAFSLETIKANFKQLESFLVVSDDDMINMIVNPLDERRVMNLFGYEHTSTPEVSLALLMSVTTANFTDEAELGQFLVSARNDHTDKNVIDWLESRAVIRNDRPSINFIPPEMGDRIQVAALPKEFVSAACLEFFLDNTPAHMNFMGRCIRTWVYRYAHKFPEWIALKAQIEEANSASLLEAEKAIEMRRALIKKRNSAMIGKQAKETSRPKINQALVDAKGRLVVPSTSLTSVAINTRNFKLETVVSYTVHFCPGLGAANNHYMGSTAALELWLKAADRAYRIMERAPTEEEITNSIESFEVKCAGTQYSGLAASICENSMRYKPHKLNRAHLFGLGFGSLMPDFPTVSGRTKSQVVLSFVDIEPNKNLPYATNVANCIMTLLRQSYKVFTVPTADLDAHFGKKDGSGFCVLDVMSEVKDCDMEVPPPGFLEKVREARTNMEREKEVNDVVRFKQEEMTEAAKERLERARLHAESRKARNEMVIKTKLDKSKTFRSKLMEKIQEQKDQAKLTEEVGIEDLPSSVLQADESFNFAEARQFLPDVAPSAFGRKKGGPPQVVVAQPPEDSKETKARPRGVKPLSDLMYGSRGHRDRRGKDPKT